MDDGFRAIERAWRSSPEDQELRERLRKARQRRWGFDPYDPICRSEHLVSTTTSTSFVRISGLDISDEIAKRPPQRWLVSLSACVRGSISRPERRDYDVSVYVVIGNGEASPTHESVAGFRLHGQAEQVLHTSTVIGPGDVFTALWRVDRGTGSIRTRTIVAVPLSPVEPSGVSPAV